MQLNHLALAVRDQARSQDFYRTYFGFDTEVRDCDNGARILHNDDGFDLALAVHDGTRELPPFLHFGFRCRGPEDVRTLERRFADDEVPVVERVTEPDFVSIKCVDPDGYVVEVYWEG